MITIPGPIKPQTAAEPQETGWFSYGKQEQSGAGRVILTREKVKLFLAAAEGKRLHLLNVKRYSNAAFTVFLSGVRHHVAGPFVQQ